MSVSSLVEEAQRAAATGAIDKAISLLRAALEREPDNPQILNLTANRLLAAGDASGAVDLLERATRLDPKAPPLWLNLAIAERQRGNAEREEAALNQALAAEPYFVPALLQKGELCESIGRESDAARCFTAVLTIVGNLPGGVPAGLEPRVRHAREMVGKQRAGVAARIRAATADTGASSSRFDYLIQILEGRQRLYKSEPTRLFFPGLPCVPFFDRDLFPWLAELEAETESIREELIAVMTASTGMRPYIDIGATDPVNQWEKLNHSLDWSAYFLWENGKRVDEHCAACPRTAALVERLPLYDVPGHAPTAMFSILKPGAHIPPHTGDTNIRAVVHLPLVVPAGCEFRVGAEQHPWQEGEAWAFDDTIEHEAWNPTAQARAILILDVWNPYLTDDERVLLRAAEQVVKSGGSVS